MKLLDIMPVLSVHSDVRISVDGSFVGQFNILDVPYRYLDLQVNCIYPIKVDEKVYTGIDLISQNKHSL